MTAHSYHETSTSWNSIAVGSMENQSKEINATIPEELRFNQNSLTVVLVYSVLFVIAAVGNLTVFISLFRSRHRKSRISLMIRHLAIADLVVTFIMIPIEVSFTPTQFMHAVLEFLVIPIVFTAAILVLYKWICTGVGLHQVQIRSALSYSKLLLSAWRCKCNTINMQVLKQVLTNLTVIREATSVVMVNDLKL